MSNKSDIEFIQEKLGEIDRAELKSVGQMQKEFRREWGLRGVGMGMPSDSLHGATCFWHWFYKPTKETELTKALSVAVKAMNHVVNPDIACSPCNYRNANIDPEEHRIEVLRKSIKQIREILK